jgi:LmbE family N-acetylglucosaminyl deacetylase
MFIADGESARRGVGIGDLSARVRQRREAAWAAAEILGHEVIESLEMPDNRLDSIPLLEVVQQIERVIETTKPSRVVTHRPDDLNVDHEVTSRAVVTAVRPFATPGPVDVLMFDSPSASEWSHLRTLRHVMPNYFVDVTSAIDLKHAALSCYAGEMRESPHPRSWETLAAVARAHGAACGVDAAEAFVAHRVVET